ncbi:LpqB family beta-propeller domain-containing protein [Frigoribacterium sp. UYMn621]|uniref:LpqB family beta-propeller domain-containing protein n=1 Tax=Frigoribacterium sp. UYMn621 TaxID=3156343 RepID=UPI0033966F42
MPERRGQGLRRALLAAGIAASMLALSACVSIPDSGPVNAGLSLSEDSSGSNVAFNPEGPERGATQQGILKGFIASFTSATGGYAISRQFLSQAFSTKWDPRQSVLVRSSAPQISQIDDTKLTYSFDTLGAVDGSGAYSQSSQSFTLPFSFVLEGGQWRINAAPDGIVLADQTFERIFRQYPVYFFAPDNRYLVPDIRWYASGTASTRIVTALLAGPPDWLKGAAFSRFPDGTKLSDASSVVTQVEGVAEVDLSKEALGASARDRQYMYLQLTESLRSVTSISQVSLSIQGTPVQIDDLGAAAPQVDMSVDSQALVLRKNEFGFSANNRVADLAGISSKVVALAPKDATLSSDQQEVAVLGSAGVSLVRKSGAPVLIDPRPDLIAPSLDEDGYLWSVPASAPNSIIVFDSNGTQHSISAKLQDGSQMVSLEVSREGARVVMLLSTPTGPRLMVAAILRNEKLEPTGLGPAILDVSLGNGVAVDATWVDQWTVGTLITADGESKVELFAIGGQKTSLSSLIPSRQIVGGNKGKDGLRVLGRDDSAIYTWGGSSWQSSKVAVDFIATQR